MAGRPNKIRTTEQIDAERDRYYRRNYNITLEEYNKMLRVNDGRCWVCNKYPKSKPLNVDHWHGFVHIFIIVRRIQPGVWRAWTELFNESYIGRTKSQAKYQMFMALKRRSCRGLACYTCNRYILGKVNEPEVFDNAAKYLRNFDFEGDLAWEKNVR